MRGTHSRRSARYCRADNRERRPRGPDRATRTAGRSRRWNDKGELGRKFAWHILLERHAVGPSGWTWPGNAQPQAACADLIWVKVPDRARAGKILKNIDNFTCRRKTKMASRRPRKRPSSLGRHSVRAGHVVKDRRPPEAAALRAVLDNIANTNNEHPSDQGRHLDQLEL